MFCEYGPRTPRWAPETDPQRRPRLIDGHQHKTTGTRWILCTIWLCCSMELNCWFVWSEENWPLISPKVFSPFCHRWSFGSSGLLSCEHLISSDIVDLIAQILFELIWAGRDITEFNDELPERFNIVLLHYWHTIFLFNTVKLLWHNLYC